MKIKNLSKGLIVLAAVAVVGLYPLVTGAIEGTDTTGTTTNQTDDTSDDNTVTNSPSVTEDSTVEVQNRAESLREKAAELKERAKENTIARLEGKKLEICQKREDNIKNIFENVTNRSQKHYDQVTNVYARVQEFYASKALSIENYSQLISDIEAAKVAAQEAVNAIKDQTPAFSCGDDNPKSRAEEFKSLVKEKISEIKSYRDSVRKLIEAIKASLVTTEVTNNENQ